MKKFFSFITAAMAIAQPIIAYASDDPSTPLPITLSSHSDDSIPNPKPHRSPMRIPVEAWYDASVNTISILYYGEADGESKLYKDGLLIDSSSEINTTFTVSESGLYTIEVSTESWTASGSIQI